MSISLGEIYQVDNTTQNTDFIGFTFDGIHSSEFGVIRTSEGSRYKGDLLPTFADNFTQVPGGDGSYYFESFYQQKNFSISIAFDSLTEINFRKMRQWLSAKKVGKLTFDESPYKSYQVKISNIPTIQYICFDELGKRIYKGEGTINFIAFYPFGICDKKYLDEYDNLNKNEWSEAVGLLPSKIGNYDQVNSKTIGLYNPGDLETDFQAYYNFTNDLITLNSIYISEGASTLELLKFSGNFTKKGEDVYLRINSETELLEGCDINKKPTGNLYNEYITSGKFFKIPIINTTAREVRFISDDAICANLDYNYLYF